MEGFNKKKEKNNKKVGKIRQKIMAGVLAGTILATSASVAGCGEKKDGEKSNINKISQKVSDTEINVNHQKLLIGRMADGLIYRKRLTPEGEEVRINSNGVNEVKVLTKNGKDFLIGVKKFDHPSLDPTPDGGDLIDKFVMNQRFENLKECRFKRKKVDFDDITVKKMGDTEYLIGHEGNNMGIIMGDYDNNRLHVSGPFISFEEKEKDNLSLLFGTKNDGVEYLLSNEGSLMRKINNEIKKKEILEISGQKIWLMHTDKYVFLVNSKGSAYSENFEKVFFDKTLNLLIGIEKGRNERLLSSIRLENFAERETDKAINTSIHQGTEIIKYKNQKGEIKLARKTKSGRLLRLDHGLGVDSRDIQEVLYKINISDF